MNTDVTTFTNAPNGAIITITKVRRAPDHHWAAFFAVIALLLICSGLYLLLRKQKPKPASSK